MEDLFEDYDNLPNEVKVLIEKYNEVDECEGMDYISCQNFVNELNKIGYTCLYGLDAIPHSLRKL